jgi:hypothetical protein
MLQWKMDNIFSFAILDVPHLDNQVLDRDIIIEGFETPSRRSLRNKLNYIADIIEEFDIVFFTETHLDNQVLDRNIGCASWARVYFNIAR